MTWKPTFATGRYDIQRVKTLEPLLEAIKALALPILRQRKLNSIMSALEVQIEEGGDSPEVNASLVAALRAGLLHQVSAAEAAPALAALAAFEQGEAARTEQLRAGTWTPPLPEDPEDRLGELLQRAWDLLEQERPVGACDRLLEAWELVKELAGSDMAIMDDFDSAYLDLDFSIVDWTMDLNDALIEAAMESPVYAEQHLRFIAELQRVFPAEDPQYLWPFFSGRGRALWRLGRFSEAEAQFSELVERHPDIGEIYTSWARCYFENNFQAPAGREKAEQILQRALARPQLVGRENVLVQQAILYGEWGKPEQAEVARRTLEQLLESQRRAACPQPTRQQKNRRKRQRQEKKKGKGKKRRS